MTAEAGQRLLAGWFEGDLAADDLLALEQALRADPALRAEGAAHARYIALLAAVLRPAGDRSSVDAIMALLPAHRASGVFRTLAGIDRRLRWRRRRLVVRLGAAACLVLGGIIAALASHRPSAAAAPPVVLVTIASRGGEAIDATGGRRSLVPGSAVLAGERIAAAGAVGDAFVRLARNGLSISLAGGARVALEDQREDGDFRLDLASGIISCDDASRAATSHHVHLKTPQALIVAAGDRFECSVTEGRTSVRLASGSLRVIAGGRSLRLGGGQVATILQGHAPQVEPLSAGGPIWDGLAAWKPPPAAVEPTAPWHFTVAMDGVHSSGTVADSGGHPGLASIPASGTADFHPDQYVDVGSPRSDGTLFSLLPRMSLRLRVRAEQGGVVMATLSRPRASGASTPEWASSPHCTLQPGRWQELTLPLNGFWSWKPGHDWSHERVSGIAIWGFGTGRFLVDGLRVE